MNRYCYRAYYEYKGATRLQPFRTQRDAKDVALTLSRFVEALPYVLSDPEATIEIVKEAKPDNRPDSTLVLIQTTLDDASVETALKECLDSLDLYADKLGADPSPGFRTDRK